MEDTLIDKFLKNQITEEEFETELSKLSPEAKAAAEKEAAEKKPSAIKELIGIRKDKDKITTKIETEDFGKKLRDEHYQKAKDDFFTQFGIEKDEDRKSFEEGFKKFDSGKVDVENIIKDMKSFYVSTKPDEFLALAEDKKKREQEAEEMQAQAAGSNGGGGGGNGAPKVSKELKAYMDASAREGMPLTVEQATKNLAMAKNGGRIPTF